ncbi:J domain-containing protein CG6693-like [Contarinia nasturtii]|uniref:J domain-containing protein CG6693-like n=1 Tax=Contarinia nasturtii TaxID=265458 RepID=UPI0012D37BCE|nr:J domain-containing protein CG6693-like [Contarinia nasturtii]
MTALKHFGTRDLYEILQIDRDAQIQDVKRAFFNMAKKYHPDRVEDAMKIEAGEKFNIIHNAYTILSQPEKKKLYDEGRDVLFTRKTIAAGWEIYMKPVQNNDIEQAKKMYQGSKKEEEDLIREFKAGKGSLTHILNNLPFMRVEDENRIIETINDLVYQGKLPKIKIKKIRK